MSAVAVIGKSIVIKGELSGNEDLTIEGKVEGKVSLANNNLIVGAEGRVTADLFAQKITITGKVEGDVSATEVVEIAASGSLKGNIRSPRLVITDGAFFQGSVEMQKPATDRNTKPAPKMAEVAAGKPVVEVA